MNRELEIATFRSEMLPKYVAYVENPNNKVILMSKKNLKQCAKCGEWLPKTEFYHANRNYCKKCEKIQVIERNKKK